MTRPASYGQLFGQRLLARLSEADSTVEIRGGFRVGSGSRGTSNPCEGNKGGIQSFSIHKALQFQIQTVEATSEISNVRHHRDQYVIIHSSPNCFGRSQLKKPFSKSIPQKTRLYHKRMVRPLCCVRGITGRAGLTGRLHNSRGPAKNQLKKFQRSSLRGHQTRGRTYSQRGRSLSQSTGGFCNGTERTLGGPKGWKTQRLTAAQHGKHPLKPQLTREALGCSPRAWISTARNASREKRAPRMKGTGMANHHALSPSADQCLDELAVLTHFGAQCCFAQFVFDAAHIEAGRIL